MAKSSPEPGRWRQSKFVWSSGGRFVNLNSMRAKKLWGHAALLLSILLCGATSRGANLSVGVAKVDITPDYPVRLSGFGFRRTESEGVTQRIWAKALALNNEGGEPAVLI